MEDKNIFNQSEIKDTYFRNILKQNSTDLQKSLNDFYTLGQASIIAYVLSKYSDNPDFHNIQKELRVLMDQNVTLREYVYKVMEYV